VRYVIREGFDIKTVTTPTRDVAACLEAALIVRDRTCARPGCGKRLGLERDHRDVDFSDDGPTELDNLVRCRRHTQERALHRPGPPAGCDQRQGQCGLTAELSRRD